MGRLAGKIAVVTGAASGIGRAAAEGFVREGARCLLVDQNGAGLREVVAGLPAGAAVAWEADVADEPASAGIVERALAHWGRIDVYYANAGIPQRATPVWETETAAWERILAVNARSVFLALKHALPVMIRQRAGSFIITASTAAVRPRPGLGAYSASKGAVIALAKAAALEAAPYGVRVNCINPVATDTPMLPNFMPGDDPSAGIEAFRKTVPLGRLARPEDIAQAALYLASDESSLVTGIMLVVDGGRCI